MENPKITAMLTQPDGVCARLAKARIGANLRGNQLAQRLGWRPTKVSKLELGQQLPTAEDVHAWLRACGQHGPSIQEAVVLLDDVRHAYAEVQRDHRRQAARDQDVDAIAEAYRTGYEHALADMRGHLDGLAALSPNRGSLWTSKMTGN